MIHGTDQLVRAWCREADQLDAVNPTWSSFVARWMAFNAFYNLLDSKRELDRVKQAITVFLTPRDCTSILKRVGPELDFLAMKPPGDDRLSSDDPAYREESTANLRVARDESKTAEARLSALFGAIYLVRCNLVHGNKHPEWSRDKELVRCCGEILKHALPNMQIRP
jgi:hypothetical protein